jgi:hypothetical protein
VLSALRVPSKEQQRNRYNFAGGNRVADAPNVANFINLAEAAYAGADTRAYKH